MTDLPEFPDIPVAEIKHSNGQKETVYQRPDGTEYVAIDILPKIKKPEPQPAMSQPIWPPDPFMPSTWKSRLKLAAHFYDRERANLQALDRKWIKEHQ